MMKYLHTNEAKAFLSNPENEGEKLSLLPVFLAKGTSTIVSVDHPTQRKNAASAFMSAVNNAHGQLLMLMRPFFFLDKTGIFENMPGVDAYDETFVLHPLVMPAVDLVVDYDIFIALTHKYPDVVEPEVRLTAKGLVNRALRSVHKGTRAVNAGRPFNG